MVGEQGWTHDAQSFHTEIERVARVVTYVFVTRLLFYGALRRARGDLPAVELPASGDPVVSHAVLDGVFRNARDATGDYATVFVTDSVSNWALISDKSSRAWIRVLDVLDHFELETLSFDVLGRLFERLIDPEERYEWGQHYTSPDVVDLMLSAALPSGEGAVMDPASGGGTFLVRAYARKRAYVPEIQHNERLAEIVGFDISAFAASVSTINLASQDLSSNANYPHVAASSFFKIQKDRAFVSLPNSEGNKEPQYVPGLSAVVCNPPYIGYSKIGSTRKIEADMTFRAAEPQRSLRGRYNYHLYFWFHAAQFLAEDGRLAFITSGEWYDSDYGVALQSWLLDKFHIELVLESMAEQWFSEARVGTVVLIARKRRPDEDESELKVRFATLRKPLSALYAVNTSDDTTRLLAVDDVRDRLYGLEGSGETSDFDFSVTTQADLRAIGSDEEGTYTGGTWRSTFLRSPSQARIMAGRTDFIELGKLATIQLGLKTGKDDFFFVEVLPGASGSKQKIVGLEGWEGTVDKANLRPALQNPRDLDIAGGRRFVVPQKGLPNRYFMPLPRSRDAGMRDYVATGEDQRVHEKTLVKANAGDVWYRQTRAIVTAPWALPYNSAYDYFAVDNAVGAVLNGRFLGVTPFSNVDSELLGAILNSTFALMGRLLVGVATGNEGAYDVGPPAARRLRVPDPSKFVEEEIENVKQVLERVKARNELLPAPSALGAVDPLRRELDLAILKALGLGAGEAAAELDRVYASFARWRQSVESVESIVRENRRAVGARGGNRGGDPVLRLASAIVDELGGDTAVDLDELALPTQQVDVVDAQRPDDEDQTALIRQTNVRTRTGVVLDLGYPERVDLVRLLRDLGWAGPIPIPVDPHTASVLVKAFASGRDKTEALARARAQSQISEEQLERVVRLSVGRWSAIELTKLRAALPQGSEVEPNLLQPDGLVPEVPIS
nr:N-6 DNA methylase [Herbiconiux sp. VKM Ac-2851]